MFCKRELVELSSLVSVWAFRKGCYQVRCKSTIKKRSTIHKHNSKCILNIPTFILTFLAASYLPVFNKKCLQEAIKETSAQRFQEAVRLIM